MAIINMEFDTKSKSLSVKINGASVDNVNSVEMFEGFSDVDEPDRFHIRVNSVKHNVEEDMMEITTIIASEDEVKTDKSVELKIDEIKSAVNDRYSK